MAEPPALDKTHTQPRGTCSSCGASVFGDGDIATQPQPGQYTCTVCFLDLHRFRHLCEQSGGWDMEAIDELIESTRAHFDEIRGREIRRRARRAEADS